MTPPSRVRLTKWGKAHLVDEDDPRQTLCKLPVPPRIQQPKDERLCVDCKREANRRGLAVLREEMEQQAKERERKLAKQRGVA